MKSAKNAGTMCRRKW